MNFFLGTYKEAEVIVDLRAVGIVATLSDGESEAQVKMPEDGRRYHHPILVGNGSRTYSFSPTMAGSEVEGMHIWKWVAHYYWAPPGTGLSLRRADFTLVRLAKREFRLEFCTWEHSSLQYIVDKTSSRSLEDDFQATRIR